MGTVNAMDLRKIADLLDALTKCEQNGASVTLTSPVVTTSDGVQVGNIASTEDGRIVLYIGSLD